MPSHPVAETIETHGCSIVLRRVEGPEAAGECDADADCGRTGCGSEVCTTTAEAENVMTTCEDRACFAVLDTCGCHDGRCTWTVRPAGPAAPR